MGTGLLFIQRKITVSDLGGDLLRGEGATDTGSYTLPRGSTPWHLDINLPAHSGGQLVISGWVVGRASFPSANTYMRFLVDGVQVHNDDVSFTQYGAADVVYGQTIYVGDVAAGAQPVRMTVRLSAGLVFFAGVTARVVGAA